MRRTLIFGVLNSATQEAVPSSVTPLDCAGSGTPQGVRSSATPQGVRSSATPADAAVETSHCSVTMWVFCTLLRRRSLNSKTSEVHACHNRAVA